MALDNTISSTRVIAALNQMGYHEVERIGHLTILDHGLPVVTPYPVAIDCEFETIPLADLEQHLEDAGVDLNIFYSCLDGVGG